MWFKEELSYIRLVGVLSNLPCAEAWWLRSVVFCVLIGGIPVQARGRWSWRGQKCRVLVLGV